MKFRSSLHALRYYFVWLKYAKKNQNLGLTLQMAFLIEFSVHNQYIFNEQDVYKMYGCEFFTHGFEFLVAHMQTKFCRI